MSFPSNLPGFDSGYGHKSGTSLRGLETALPRSSQPSPPRSIHSTGSMGSIINKPLPPSPQPMPSPLIHTRRSSSSNSFKLQEEIIQSYIDRDSPGIHSPGSTNRQEQLLPPRTFATKNAAKSMLSLVVPDVRLTIGMYTKKSLYTSSDTMLAVRGVEDTSPESPRRTKMKHAYKVSLPTSDGSRIYDHGYTKKPIHLAPEPAPSSLGLSPLSQSVSNQSARSYYTYPSFPTVSEPSRSHLHSLPLSPPLPEFAIHDPRPDPSHGQSTSFANLYRNSLPPMPIDDVKSPTQATAGLERVIDHSLIPQPLRASQIPTSREQTRSKSENKHSSQASGGNDETSTVSGQKFTTLRKLVQKSLQNTKASADVREEREQQSVIETVKNEYPAMATQDPPSRQTPRSSHRRSSIQAHFGDMYDTLSSMNPVKSRSPSVSTTYPNIYEWTPLSPSFPADPSPFAPQNSHFQPEIKPQQQQHFQDPGSSSSRPQLSVDRPSYGSRQRLPAVPLTPYQELGPKAWEEEEAREKALRKAHRRKSSLQRSLNPSPKTPASQSSPCSPTQPPQYSRTWPKAKKEESSETPKTQTLNRSRADTVASDDSRGRLTWLEKRRAKKEEERSERWREDMKKKIVVIGLGEFGGGVIDVNSSADGIWGKGKGREVDTWI